MWVTIEEFPRYSISNFGHVVNKATGRYMALTKNKAGIVKVGLMKDDGNQYQRSVKVLVAEAFVPGRDEVFNTPIQLDGDQTNLRADNIVWRPYWFAWKYTNQFEYIKPVHTNKRRRIMDVKTLELYQNVYEVATTHGLLFVDIWRSIHFHEPIFPTWQEFAFVK
jgi:predicted GNAT superfamily acetyltransferase